MTLANSNVCSIPTTAKAYVLNVTLIPRSGGVDFVTIYPTGESRPNFYTVRSPDGQIVANSAIVKSGSGSINVFTSNTTDLLLDISGYFTDASASQTNLVYYPLTPCRVVETRSDYRPAGTAFGPPTMNGGETRNYRFPSSPDCVIPAGASAYAVTVTVVPPQPLAFLTAWPAGGARPNVSTLNSFAGRVLANNVIVPASNDGSISVFVFDRSDVIVDITGYFAPDNGTTGLYYFPITQCRAADSTDTTLTGTYGPPIYENETTRTIGLPAAPRCSGIPASAKAYAIHGTAQPNGNPMPFLTVYPTGQSRPNASFLNAFQGQVVTNSVIVPAGTNGAIDMFAYRRTNVIIDVSGYFSR